jgi:hypothetical protein
MDKQIKNFFIIFNILLINLLVNHFFNKKHHVRKMSVEKNVMSVYNVH